MLITRISRSLRRPLIASPIRTPSYGASLYGWKRAYDRYDASRIAAMYPHMRSLISHEELGVALSELGCAKEIADYKCRLCNARMMMQCAIELGHGDVVYVLMRPPYAMQMMWDQFAIDYLPRHELPQKRAFQVFLNGLQVRGKCLKQVYQSVIGLALKHGKKWIVDCVPLGTAQVITETFHWISELDHKHYLRSAETLIYAYEYGLIPTDIVWNISQNAPNDEIREIIYAAVREHNPSITS